MNGERPGSVFSLPESERRYLSVHGLGDAAAGYYCEIRLSGATEKWTFKDGGQNSGRLCHFFVRCIFQTCSVD